jgi:hypothetical protein
LRALGLVGPGAAARPDAPGGPPLWPLCSRRHRPACLCSTRWRCIVSSAGSSERRCTAFEGPWPLGKQIEWVALEQPRPCAICSASRAVGLEQTRPSNACGHQQHSRGGPLYQTARRGWHVGLHSRNTAPAHAALGARWEPAATAAASQCQAPACLQSSAPTGTRLQ